jgi:DNA-binding NarL/FixJ family response regulator
MEPKTDQVRRMWARQGISSADVDYPQWEVRRVELTRMAEAARSYIFMVDVYKGVYDYISENFAELFGVRPATVEELVHPDDRVELASLQLRHAKFIYTLPPHERNDYRTIYQVRMRGADGGYINITSRQQVVETDRNGKAWIVMGMLELAPDQSPATHVKCSVLNIHTGCFFNPWAESQERALTGRETEILSLMSQGLPSKQIATHLGVSKSTIDNHRKNILAKLDADNAIEAINRAREAGLIA